MIQLKAIIIKIVSNVSNSTDLPIAKKKNLILRKIVKFEELS